MPRPQRSPQPRSLPSVVVFDHRTALAHGWTRAALAHAVGTGALVRLRRGWYADAARLVDPIAVHAAQATAADAATAQDTLVSHESAGLIHGLWLRRDPRDPLLSRSRQARGPRLAVDAAPLASQVPPEHRVLIGGIPLTSLARTAIDLARRGDPLAGVMAIDSALRLGATLAQLEEVLTVAHGWPGVVLARELVVFGDPRSESPLESVGRWRFHKQRLPAPDLQRWIGRDRVDFLWEDERVVGEADGLGKYDDGRPAGVAGREEKARELRLQAAGFEVVRFGWDEAVRGSVALAARVRTAFRTSALRYGPHSA